MFSFIGSRAAEILSAAHNHTFLSRRDNPADASANYLAAATVLRSPASLPDVRHRLESSSGVPFMLLAQATAGFTLPFVPAVVAIGCPRRAAEGQGLDPQPQGSGSFAVPETILIWLPAARGESNAPLALKVIAVRAATPRVSEEDSCFHFSFLFFGGASLRHRMFVLAIHRRAGNPAEFFTAIFPRGSKNS